LRSVSMMNIYINNSNTCQLVNLNSMKCTSSNVVEDTKTTGGSTLDETLESSVVS
jgi:hypothetical protein